MRWLVALFFCGVGWSNTILITELHSDFRAQPLRLESAQSLSEIDARVDDVLDFADYKFTWLGDVKAEVHDLGPAPTPEFEGPPGILYRRTSFSYALSTP